MTNTSQSRTPSHRVYTVKGNGDTARWIEIGAAWANADGKGLSVTLDAFPVDGRLVIRTITERADKPAGTPAGKGGQS